MTKYHINPETGNPNVCRAQPGKCRFRTENGNEDTHYASKDEARVAYERIMEGIPTPVERNTVGDNVDTEKIDHMSVIPEEHREVERTDSFYNLKGVDDPEAIDMIATYYYHRQMTKADSANRDWHELQKAKSREALNNTEIGHYWKGWAYDRKYDLDSAAWVNNTLENIPDTKQQSKSNEVFESKDEIREGETARNADEVASYANESASFLKGLTPTEQNAVSYWTSAGSTVVKDLTFKGRSNWGIQNEDPEDDGYFDPSGTMSAVDSALDKSDLGHDRILYRGVNMDHMKSLDSHEDVREWALKNYKEGDDLTFDFPESSTSDTSVANKFSTGLIFEVKARKAAPVGAVSAWGYNEMEYILPRNTKYRVVGVHGNVGFQVNKKVIRQHTVVQLEQIID